MKKFQVIADSTCDVQETLRLKYELDYAKMLFTIGDKEYQADLDWQEITPKEYYDMIRAGERSYTGLEPTAEFEAIFTKYLEEGMDILYISCSSKLSGTINNAKLISQELLDNYPNRKIICFDSLRSNYAQGLMAIDAAKMALEGKSIEETVDYLTKTRLNYQVYATVGTLDYLKKSGRIKASAAFFGNIMGVKPIILSDAIGNNFAFKKVKGRKASLDELVNIIKSKMIDPNSNTLHIEHADCLEDALYIKKNLENHVKNIEISYLGPIIGATIGPNSITCSFYGEEVKLVGE